MFNIFSKTKVENISHQIIEQKYIDAILHISSNNEIPILIEDHEACMLINNIGNHIILCDKSEKIVTFNNFYKLSFEQHIGGKRVTNEGTQYWDGIMTVIPNSPFLIFKSLYYGNSTASLNRELCLNQIETYRNHYEFGF
jgi:hypothetical protein